MPETMAALTVGSKLSVTSHLSLLVEDDPNVAVRVKSPAWGCKCWNASCNPKAC